MRFSAVKIWRKNLQGLFDYLKTTPVVVYIYICIFHMFTLIVLLNWHIKSEIDRCGTQMCRHDKIGVCRNLSVAVFEIFLKTGPQLHWTNPFQGKQTFLALVRETPFFLRYSHREAFPDKDIFVLKSQLPGHLDFTGMIWHGVEVPRLPRLPRCPTSLRSLHFSLT